MNCVPLISDSPSFASSTIGSSPTRASASTPGQPLALDERLALADERQREMRERREIAGRADRAARRHDGQDAAVEAREQQLDRADAGAGRCPSRACSRAAASRRARSRPAYGSPTPHACERSRRSCSSPVSSSGIERLTNRPKPVLTPYVCSLVPCAARSTSSRAALHLRRAPRRSAPAGARSTATAQTSATRQVVAGEADGRALRHAASLEPVRSALLAVSRRAGVARATATHRSPSMRKRRAGSRRRGAGRHQPDELGARDLARRAPPPRARSRATISCSALASQSSTFMLTCA